MAEIKKIALLIDCDNSSHHSIEGVLAELAKQGVVNVRHAHGDWNHPTLSGWQKKLHPNALRPMQQFAYTKGKNATDSAMIIDAMDLLYSQNIDLFALVTSDSDFTPLVLRIRENGLLVYGFGEDKTPKPFVDACSTFIYTGNLTAETEKPETTAVSVRKSKAELRRDKSLVQLLRTAVDQASEDDEWAYMAKVGSYISNQSSFSSINYGYKKLSDLIRASELFDFEMRNQSMMYIRRRHSAKKVT